MNSKDSFRKFQIQAFEEFLMETKGKFKESDFIIDKEDIPQPFIIKEVNPEIRVGE